MLVICEDCAKKYDIDETLIKGEAARFSCRECGHIIVAQKPSPKVKGNSQKATVIEDKKSAETAEDSTQATPKQTITKSAKTTGKGVPIGMYLFLAPTAGLLLIFATIGYLYFLYIPQLINQQVNLRTAEITEKDARIEVGNQKVQDRVVALPETGGEVQVGIFRSEIDQAINDALFSTRSLFLFGVILAGVVLIFFLMARFISKPLQELTDVVNRISLGELDLSVQPEGPREIRELASALERMRYSIKTAMERMRKMS